MKLMTWNIFDWGIERKYGIDIRAENPVTRDSYRQSVKPCLVNGRRSGEPVKGDQNSTAWNQDPRKGLEGMVNWQWLAV